MSRSRPFLDRVRQSRMRRYWTRKLEAGPVDETLRKDARKLRRILDEIERSGFAALKGDPPNPSLGLPTATIWADRPHPWSTPIAPTGPTPLVSGAKLSPDTTLYHDANSSKIFTRQANSRTSSTYELSLDIAEFDGSYVSLAIGLPSDQIASIQRSDLLRVDVAYTSDRPINATARANIKIGPNVETIIREIDPTRAKPMVEFDLFYAELDTQEITDVWIDLIFERPTMNVITLHDLRLSRRPRAKT